MGGVDKPLLDIAGRPMLGRIIDAVAPQVTAIALSANADPARFSAFALPVLADDEAAHRGPLAGILAGLRWAEALGGSVTHMLTVPGDTPFLPHDLASRLHRQCNGRPGCIVVAASNGRRHHTIALWPVGLADTLADHLRTVDDNRVAAFIEAHDHVEISFAQTGPCDPFFNVNTPHDLERARTFVAAP